jgi:hypothetical protein
LKQVLAQGSSSKDIWTPDVRLSFYKNICALSTKVGERSLRGPEDFRRLENQRSDPEQYTLSYEKELHITDHFAFLAHVAEGVEFVSAVTLEESHNPSSLTTRDAPYRTPRANVIEVLTE